MSHVQCDEVAMGLQTLCRVVVEESLGSMGLCKQWAAAVLVMTPGMRAVGT